MYHIREVEITKRCDGKFNVWAFIPDPTMTAEEHQHIEEAKAFPCKRWVVIDVLKATTEAAKFRSKGIATVILLPTRH